MICNLVQKCKGRYEEKTHLVVTFLLLNLSLSQGIQRITNKQNTENWEIHNKKEYDSWKVWSYFPLLVKMNHNCVWELSEKNNCKYCFLFPTFYHILVPMKKKLHFLKHRRQRQRLHSIQPANLEVNLGSLILFSCPSFWSKWMRPIFNVHCPCAQSLYFTFLGSSCTQLRWRGGVLSEQSFESLVLKSCTCNFSLLCLIKHSCVLDACE